jgi:hypothetical protein
MSGIQRKKKICAVCGNPEYLFSHGKCRGCWERTRSKSINKLVDDDLSGLIEDADAIFSKYVRMSATSEFGEDSGYASCYTCGCIKRWQEQQCGHYISRSNYHLRWDLRNTKVQCWDCNVGKHGNLGVYTERLEREYPDLPKILMEESKIVYSQDRDEIRGIIREYSRKIEMFKIDA